MKNKLIVALLLFMFIPSVSSVSAAEVTSGSDGLTGDRAVVSIVKGSDPTKQPDFCPDFANGSLWGMPDRCMWSNGKLKMGNKMSYCLDWHGYFEVGKKYKEVNNIDFFMMKKSEYIPDKASKTSKTEDDAKKILRKLAIIYKTMYEYFDKNQAVFDGGSSETYFFGQTRIWTVLNDYYGWGDNGYWIDTAVSSNWRLFGKSGCNQDNSGASCMADWETYTLYNSIIQDALNKYDNDDYEADLKQIHVWLFNDNKGSHPIWQPHITFDSSDIIKKKPKYDYSLDSACVGCEPSEKGKTAVSYIIQDIDNWKLLGKIYDSNENIEFVNSSVKDDYFHKKMGSDYVCREEFQISFPHESSKNSLVRIQSGGYFTININDYDANVSPIHAKRVIQCKNFRGGVLDVKKLKETYCNDSNYHAAKINLAYDENNSKKYNYNTKDYGTDGMVEFNKGCGVSTSGDKAVLVIASDYKLGDGVYQYVEKNTNTFVKDRPSDAGKNYTRLPYSVLPTHLDNKKDNGEAGTLTFKFELPNDSNMKPLYENDDKNEYFLLKGQSPTDAKQVNIYNLENWNANDEINRESKKGSACMKLYGDEDDAENCRKYRVDIADKIKLCKGKDYKCRISTFDDTTPPPPGGNECTIISIGSSPTDNKFILKDGSMSNNKDTFISQCCNKDNHLILGVPYNSETGECGTNPPNNGVCNEQTVGTGKWTEYYWGYNYTTKHEECCLKDDLNCDDKPDVDCEDAVNGECDIDHKCADPETLSCPPDGKTCEHDPGSDIYKINDIEVERQRYISACCNSKSDADGLTLDWNEDDGHCCADGETYNKETKMCQDDPGKPDPDPDPDGGKSCSEECGSIEMCCPVEEGGGCGIKLLNPGDKGCEDSTEKCLVCSSKPKKGSNNPADAVVYRVVDLSMPFVGEQAGDTSVDNEGKRNTGNNWAALLIDADGQHFDSSYDNALVTEIFGEENGYDSSNVEYHFTLDTKAINTIRDYNRGKSYADFTLVCKNGKNCRSTFIDEIRDVTNASGKCLGKQNLTECK